MTQTDEKVCEHQWLTCTVSVNMSVCIKCGMSTREILTRMEAHRAGMLRAAEICECDVCDQEEYACETITRIAAAIREAAK